MQRFWSSTNEKTSNYGIRSDLSNINDHLSRNTMKQERRREENGELQKMELMTCGISKFVGISNHSIKSIFLKLKFILEKCKVIIE